MDQMTHRERVAAALSGAPVDRPAISLWRHFGGIDMTARGLTEAMVGFQATYDFDFVKFMPTGTYTIIDWGADTAWEPNDHGIRTVRSVPIRDRSDWSRLEPLDTGSGVLGMVNEALARTVVAVGRETPVLQTIFSPLATARKLGGAATLAHLRQDPDALQAGLDVIEAVTRQLIRDAVDRGGDIFYVLQSGTADVLTRDEFERWETEPAKRLLAGVPAEAIVVLHSHGDFLWFDELADWPINGINWHDRVGGPTLRDARSRTSKGLVGGIEAWKDLRGGTEADVTRQVHDALAAAAGVVIAPGCVIPTDAAPHLILAARQAVTTTTALATPTGSIR